MKIDIALLTGMVNSLTPQPNSLEERDKVSLEGNAEVQVFSEDNVQLTESDE